MKNSTKKGLLIAGVCLVSFRLLLFIVEFGIAKKQSMTMEEYTSAKPTGDWFELKNAELDMTQATYFSFLGVGSGGGEIFVPVVAPGDTIRNVEVLLKTKNIGLVAFAKKIQEMDESELLNRFIQSPNEYFLKREVVTGYRANMKSTETDKLRAEFPNLRIILEDGEGPPYTVAGVLVAVLGVLVFFLVKNIRDEKAQGATA